MKQFAENETNKMTKKEMMDLFLSKLPEEKREDFLKDIRSCKTKKEVKALLKKYGVALSEDEAKMLHESMQKEIAPEDMKNVAGGFCSCECDCCWVVCVRVECSY